jgi:hypothetical protein
MFNGGLGTAFIKVFLPVMRTHLVSNSFPFPLNKAKLIGEVWGNRIGKTQRLVRSVNSTINVRYESSNGP